MCSQQMKEETTEKSSKPPSPEKGHAEAMLMETFVDVKAFLMKSALSPTLPHTSWALDSGASAHATGNSSLLMNMKKLRGHNFVHTADGQSHMVTAFGNVKLPTISGDNHIIRNVLLVPGLTMNLLSIGALTDAGMMACFDSSLCVLAVAVAGEKRTQLKIIAKGQRDNATGLYYLHFKHLNIQQQEEIVAIPGDRVHEKVESGPLLIQLDGELKQKSCESLGEVQDRSGAHEGSVNQKATQMNRTSELYHTTREGINETADTVNDSADQLALSKSTLGANKSDEHEAPGPGVKSNWLKLKDFSQILESFAGNKTADTFDTIQDREVISESTAGTGTTARKAENATSPFDHTHAKIPVHDKAHEAAANFDRQMADASKSARDANEEVHTHSNSNTTGLTWEELD